MSESCRVFPHLTSSLWVFLHHIALSPPGLGLSNGDFIQYLSHMSCSVVAASESHSTLLNPMLRKESLNQQRRGRLW